MKIRDLHLIDRFPYIDVTTERDCAGRTILKQEHLPICHGFYEGTEEMPDFLLLCADLQGLVEAQGEYRLMGEVVPTYVQLLLEEQFEIEEATRVGVLLCGDFYSSPAKRGTSGDVRSVWEVFQEEFDWVVGVAGNHDRFGRAEEPSFLNPPSALLRQEQYAIDGFNFGGISGIIGKITKPQRVDASVYLNSLEQLLKQNLDAILLHEAPNYPPLNFIGNPAIRKVLQASKHKATIFCGHCNWAEALVCYENGVQVVNVDKRFIILEKTPNQN